MMTRGTGDVASFKLVAEDKAGIEVGGSVRFGHSVPEGEFLLKSQVPTDPSGTLQPPSLEAKHEGLSVLSNRRCSTSAFCCRTYTWFSAVRSRLGSGYPAWLHAIHSL